MYVTKLHTWVHKNPQFNIIVEFSLLAQCHKVLEYKIE